MSKNIELGCGLIAIGRQWGTTPVIPTEAEALRFLEAAYELGVRVFDTAPSYGLSEGRLGVFLSGLTPDERKEVTVATKFGEHWSAESNSAYADHSLDALKRSLDQSVHLLGSIAILQLHKTTPELLRDNTDIDEAIAYAVEAGIGMMGVSVSDPISAEMAAADSRFGAIQLPFNRASEQFRSIIEAAAASDKFLLTNRPFQMGQVTADQSADKNRAAVEAFSFILQEDFNGVILTGTSSTAHLQENLAAFKIAHDDSVKG